MPIYSPPESLLAQIAGPAAGGINFGGMFDAMLAVKQQEQKNGQELFQMLSKANPTLASQILLANPGLARSMVETPKVSFGGGPKKAKPAAGGAAPAQGAAPAPSLGEQVAEAFRAATAGLPKDEAIQYEPSTIATLTHHMLEELTEEALANPAAQKAYWESKFYAGTPRGVAALEALAKGGALRRADKAQTLADTADFLYTTSLTNPDLGPSLDPQMKPGPLTRGQATALALRPDNLGVQAALIAMRDQLDKGQPLDANQMEGLIKTRTGLTTALAEAEQAIPLLEKLGPDYAPLIDGQKKIMKGLAASIEAMDSLLNLNRKFPKPKAGPAEGAPKKGRLSLDAIREEANRKAAEAAKAAAGG